MVDATVSSVARLSPGVWVDLTTGVVNGQPGNLLPEMQLQRVGALWARRDTVSTWEDLSRALYPGVALGSPRALASAKNRLKQLKHQVEVSLSTVSEGLVLIEAVRGQGLRLVSPPTRTALVGREEVVAAAIGHLRSSGAVALVGLPGVGLRAVLAEVMARAASLDRGVQVLRSETAPEPSVYTVYVGVAPVGVPQVELPPLRHELLAELVRARATRLLRVAPQAETVEAIVRMADGFPGMAARLVAALTTEGEAALRRRSPALLRAGVDPARRADWVALGEERQRLLSACALFVHPFSDAALDELLPGGAALLPGLAAWVGGSPAARWVAPEARLLSTEAGLAAALIPAYAAWVLRQAEGELLPVRLGSAAARGRLAALVRDLEGVAASCRGELRARALLGLAEAEAPAGLDQGALRAALEDAPSPWSFALRLRVGLLLRRGSSADDDDLNAALSSPEPEVRGRARMALALRARDAGAVAEALRMLDEADAEARTAGALWLRGRVAANKVRLLEQLGRPEEADAAHAKALQLARASEDQVTVARILGNRANLLRRRGEIDGAFEVSKREVEALRSLGDRRGLAIALANQAAILLQGQDRSLARERLLGAIQANEALSPGAVATARLNLGLLCMVERHYAEAATHLALAREGFVEVGDRVGEALVLADRGALFLAQGKVEAGLEALERARGMARNAGAAELSQWVNALLFLVRSARSPGRGPPPATPSYAWLASFMADVAARGQAALVEGPPPPDPPDIRHDVVRGLLRGLNRAG